MKTILLSLTCALFLTLQCLAETSQDAYITEHGAFSADGLSRRDEL